MAELRHEGAIAFTDDGKPVVSAGMMRKALQYQRLAGGLLALHEEDPALSGRGAMHEGEVSALLGIAGIPSVSESTMVARDCALAGYEGGRIHLQHLSCIESVQAVAAAKEAGVQVTCEASPHHLCLTEQAVRSLDTRMKMNPPLRTEADRQALIEGLRSGIVDCIATDHAPHARDEKEVPFEQAPMGTTGLETAFAAVHSELVRPRRARPGHRRRAHDGRRRALRDPGPARAGGGGGQPRARRPRRRVGGGRGRLREPLGALLLRRPRPARARAAHARRRRRRLSRAGLRGDRGMTAPGAYVLLEDGTRFDGDACGADPHAAVVTGEVVFTTGMSGYQESMTDPSFARQLITFTYPHVGNYGVSQEAMESERPWARAAIMRAAVNREDAPGAERGWLDWLSDCGVPAITGVDTRALVRHIRTAGAMRGGVFPAAMSEARGPRADRRRATDGRPGPRARGHAGGDERARRRRRAAHRGHRHRDQGLDRAQPRVARRARRAAPVHGARRRS